MARTPEKRLDYAREMRAVLRILDVVRVDECHDPEWGIAVEEHCRALITLLNQPPETSSRDG